MRIGLRSPSGSPSSCCPSVRWLGSISSAWAAAPKTWIEPCKAVQPVRRVLRALGGVLALVLTFGFVLLLLLAAAAPGANAVKFAVSFTVIFWLAYLCWVLGNFAYIAVTTPADMEKFGIGWSLQAYR